MFARQLLDLPTHFLGALRHRSIHRFVSRTIPPCPIPDVPNFYPEFLGYLLSGFVSATPMVYYRSLKLFAVNFGLLGSVAILFLVHIFFLSNSGNCVQFFGGRAVRLINLPALGYNVTKNDPVGWVDARFHRRGVDLTLHAVDGNQDKDGQLTCIEWS
jgi:hypothetical protein